MIKAVLITCESILKGSLQNLLDIVLLFMSKPVASLCMMALGTTLGELFRTYIWHDLSILPFLAIVVVMDAVAGFRAAKYLNKKDPDNYEKATWQTFRERLASKATSYVIALTTLNVMTQFKVNGVRAQDQLTNLNLAGYELNLPLLQGLHFTILCFFIYHEGRSVARNLKVTGFRFFNLRTETELDKILGADEETETASKI